MDSGACSVAESQQTMHRALDFFFGSPSAQQQICAASTRRHSIVLTVPLILQGRTGTCPSIGPSNSSLPRRPSRGRSRRQWDEAGSRKGGPRKPASGVPQPTVLHVLHSPFNIHSPWTPLIMTLATMSLPGPHHRPKQRQDMLKVIRTTFLPTNASSSPSPHPPHPLLTTTYEPGALRP